MTAKRQTDEFRATMRAHDRQIAGLIKLADKHTRALRSLAASVIAHDEQIEALIRVVDKNSKDISRVGKQIQQISRDWQAYLGRLPMQ